jgi:hypothetical protein
MELESYSDGVSGWSGISGSIAPPIAPGDSFPALMTPPRAGTFIYHVHNEANDELASGLYGALMVLEPGETPDPDRVFVIGEPGPNGHDPAGRPPFVNGTLTPPAQDLVGIPIASGSSPSRRARFTSCGWNAMRKGIPGSRSRAMGRSCRPGKEWRCGDSQRSQGRPWISR